MGTGNLPINWPAQACFHFSMAHIKSDGHVLLWYAFEKVHQIPHGCPQISGPCMILIQGLNSQLMIEGSQVFGHRLEGRSLRGHGFIHVITEIVHTVSLDTPFCRKPKGMLGDRVIDTVDARSHDGHLQALATKSFHQFGQVFIHFFRSDEPSGANRSLYAIKAHFSDGSSQVFKREILEEFHEGTDLLRRQALSPIGSPLRYWQRKPPEQTKLQKGSARV